jgi:tight adherence protein B
VLTAFGLAFWGVAIFLLVPTLHREFEERWREAERDRLASIERGFSREFFFVEPERLRRLTRWGLLSGLALSAFSRSPFPFLASLLAAGVLPSALLWRIKNRRKRLLEHQLCHVLPTISATLRAGQTFERAVELLVRTESPPISQEFGLCLKEIRFGATLPEALENLARRCPCRDLEVMVRAVILSSRAGSNLAEAFDRVAETVRARALLRDRLSSLTAQGKAQAWVAIALPLVLVVVLQIIAPDYLDPLFRSGVGRMVLAFSALALLIGGIWVGRISRMEFLQ